MEKVKKFINIRWFLLIALTVSFIVLLFFTYYQSNHTKSTGGIDNETMPLISSPTVPSKAITIGWSVYDIEYEFFYSMHEGVLAKADELGIKVLTHIQTGDTSDMVSGAIRLIEQGIDALLICPVDPNAMEIIVEAADQANIPVVVLDIGTGGAEVDAFLVSDSFGGGVWAAEYALQLIDKYSIKSKNAAIIKVQDVATYARRRGQAFKGVMKSRGYNIVAEPTANSDTEQAYEAMKSILENYGEDLAVVFSENDRMALGAAQAIEEAGKKGEILVIGFDGDPSAIEAIKEGRMQGTIEQQPFKIGELGVEIAKMILEGKAIAYDDKVTKEIYLEVYLVDEFGNVRKPLWEN